MDSRDLLIRETGSGIDLLVRVQPRARNCALAGIHERALKVKLTAPPVDQAANRAVVEFFASLLEIPKSRISIVSGERSRTKTLRIAGIGEQEFLRRISPSMPGG